MNQAVQNWAAAVYYIKNSENGALASEAFSELYPFQGYATFN